MKFRFYGATILRQMLIIFATELLYLYHWWNTEDDEHNYPIHALGSLFTSCRYSLGKWNVVVKSTWTLRGFNFSICTWQSRFCPVPSWNHLLFWIRFYCCVLFIRYWFLGWRWPGVFWKKKLRVTMYCYWRGLCINLEEKTNLQYQPTSWKQRQASSIHRRRKGAVFCFHV